MIDIGNLLNHLPLLSRKRPISIDRLSVRTFAGIPADGDDGDVIGLFRSLDITSRDVHLGKNGTAQQARAAAHGRESLPAVIDVAGVPFLEVLVDIEAGGGEPFVKAADVRLVDIAGTGAAGDHVIGADAEKRHILHALHGKSGPVVLEQHQAFSRALADQLSMRCEIRLVGILVLRETRGAYDVFQHSAHVGVELFFGDISFADPRDDPRHLCLIAGLHQVISGIDGFYRAFLGAPVGHHDAVIPPFVPKDGGEQTAALLGEFPVQLVVRGHDGPWIGLFDHDLEALQIEFAKGAPAYPGIGHVAVGLGVIGSIVLGAHADPVALDAFDIGGRHFSGEQRIFGKILEVAATERITMKVHSRCQQHVDPVFFNLLSHRGRKFLDERGIPGAGHHGSHRKSGAVIGVLVVAAGRADAQPSGAVRKHGPGDAESRNGAGSAGRTGHEIPDLRRDARKSLAPSGAYEQTGLFLQGHGVRHLVDVVPVKLGLSRHRHDTQRPGKE